MPKTVLPRKGPIVDEGLTPVYPEEWLGMAGAGRALVGSVLRKVGAPLVKNAIYPQLAGELRGLEYAVRNVKSADEIADIMRSGYARAARGSSNPAGNKKYWTERASDYAPRNPEGVSAIRAKTSKVKRNRAVKRKNIEQFDPTTNTWRPITEMNRVK